MTLGRGSKFQLLVTNKSAHTPLLFAVRTADSARVLVRDCGDLLGASETATVHVEHQSKKADVANLWLRVECVGVDPQRTPQTDAFVLWRKCSLGGSARSPRSPTSTTNWSSNEATLAVVTVHFICSRE